MLAGTRRCPWSCGRRSPLEDLGAERRERRAEQRGRARDRALAVLAHAVGTREREKVERAEVRRRQVGDVELEIRLVVRTLDGLADAVAPVVPGAELVANAQDDSVAVAVGARAERRLDVDEAEPEPVGEAQAEAARVLH